MATDTERWIDMVPGIRRRTLSSGAQMHQMIVTLAAGSLLPEHQHPHEQITHVISGQLRMIVAGVPHDLGPGESICMPGGTPHGAQALADTLVVDTFSPPRADLLAEDARLAAP